MINADSFYDDFDFYDKDLRARFLKDPKNAFSELSPTQDVEVVVKKNTANISYFVIPRPESDEISDESLNMITAAEAGTASTAGSLTTLSTFFCVTSPSSFSTGSTLVGTAGSKGC